MLLLFLEAGRILSNTTTGKKIPGRVGLPMPNITVRIVQRNDDGSETTTVEATLNKVKLFSCDNDVCSSVSGELFVKGNQSYLQQHVWLHDYFKGRHYFDIISKRTKPQKHRSTRKTFLGQVSVKYKHYTLENYPVIIFKS